MKKNFSLVFSALVICALMFQNCSNKMMSTLSTKYSTDARYQKAMSQQELASNAVSASHKALLSNRPEVYLAPTTIKTNSIYEMIYAIDKVDAQSENHNVDSNNINFIHIGMDRTPKQKKYDEDEYSNRPETGVIQGGG